MPRVRSHHWRVAMIWVCLASYAAAGLGVFPSAAMLRKWGLLHGDPGAAFPCEHHACGCLSAQGCWEACCCYSVAQRVAWADARGALVPSWAREATHDSQTPSACCAAHAAPAPKSVVMTGLSCRGSDGWTFTGLPPVLAPEPASPSLAARPSRAPPEPRARPRHASLKPPTPPPRDARA